MRDPITIRHPDSGASATVERAALRSTWASKGWTEMTTVATGTAANAPESLPDGPVAAVIEWAGDDPTRRQEALDAENARETPRKGVLDALT